MNRPNAVAVLLAVIAVLLGLNLVVVRSSAGQVEGAPQRCCFPNTGECLDLDLITCAQAGGTPGPAGSLCVDGECGPGACCVRASCRNTFDEQDCVGQGGVYQGFGTDCTAGVECGAPCPADLNGDHEVGISDFLDLLAAWGPCP